MAAKFELRWSVNKQYYYNLKAGNSEVILTGETYTTKQNCKNGISSVRANSQIDSRFDKRVGTRNDGTEYYSFNLKSGNGEIIGVSEMYTTRQNRDNGIQSVKNNAPSAIVTDLTV